MMINPELMPEPSPESIADMSRYLESRQIIAELSMESRQALLDDTLEDDDTTKEEQVSATVFPLNTPKRENSFLHTSGDSQIWIGIGNNPSLFT
jgi:hypothetical protein